jgi:hypothetical protein
MSVRSAILTGSAAASILLVAGGAGASIPTGERHGAWHVVSITSLSGVAGDDASAILTQENAAGELKAHWVQGGPLRISAKIESCYSEDEDFYQSYSFPIVRWHALGAGEIAGRLEADFGTWLGQAKSACREATRLDLFKMARLRAAAKDFAARVSYLSGGL